MIREMTRDGGAVLLTTQYLEEADALADDIVVIDQGRVIAHGTAAQLKALVGGHTIEVRPADPTRLAEVITVLGTVAGHRAETPRRDVATVQVDGDSALDETVRRLRAAGIGVAELALRLPSLDEVFFALTGHGAQRPDESGTSKEDAA
jgi:oleandomycin transport system ATP-binding protein